MDSIKVLNEKSERFVVTLGIENHIERWGISFDKITNMSWWEETVINNLKCTRYKDGTPKIGRRSHTIWVISLSFPTAAAHSL